MPRFCHQRKLIRALLGLFVAVADQTLGESLPRITIQPSDWQQYERAGASLRVTGQSDSPIAYQWFKDGMPLVDGGQVVGATSQELRVDQMAEDDLGSSSR